MPDFTEEQLLFAVLVTQREFATPDQVAEAVSVCLTQPTLTVAEQLQSMGAITEKQRSIIELLVEKTFADKLGTVAESVSSQGPLEVKEGKDIIGKITNEEVGRYTVKGVHGRGGQARILRAFDEHVGRDVALKELMTISEPDKLSSSEWADPEAAPGVVRFLREARVTAQLEHPNIIPVYELGRRVDGTLYYTMRLIRGKTMAVKLEDCRNLKERMEYLTAFWDICNSIAYAHNRGVVHRDIKPSNVMVGEFGETVLLDWGIAKVQGSQDIGAQDIERELKLLQDSGVDETSAGSAIGTPSYMSPEQARGQIEEIDKRSDIWGLGAVLYEILTGRPPFVGKTRAEIVSQVGRRPVVPVLQLQPDAPPELAAIAQKSLRRDKKNRYQSAQELSDDLKAFMTGGRVTAYQYTAWELLKRFASHNKPIIIAAGLILAVILGALIFVSISYRSETIARQNESLARQQAASALAKEHEERLTANYHLAQAYSEKADRLMGDMRFLSANVFASASLGHNPSHPKSPFYSREFTALYPQSHDLRVEAASQIYHSRLHTSAGLRNILMAEEELWGCDFSPDGRHLAVGGFDRTIRIWDLESDRILHSLKGHTERVNDVIYSKNGKFLASAGDDNQLIIWDTVRGRIKKRIPGHAAPVRWVSFSHRGHLLASAGWDEKIKIWDTKTFKSSRVIEGHKGKVNTVSFSPDDKVLASGGEDNTVRLWRVSDGKLLHTFEGIDDRVFAVAFSPDGSLLASTGNDQVIRLWNVKKRRPAGTLEGHTDGVVRLSFSPDGKILASAGYDRTIRIWRIRTGKLMLTIDAHRGFVYGMAFSPSGDRIASAGSDKTAKVWKLLPGRPMQTLQGHGGTVYGVAFYKNGNLLASGGWDETVRIWNLRSGRSASILKGHEDVIDDLALSPDNRLLASASRDKTIRIWNRKRRRSIFTLKGHQDHVYGLAFSPDGKLLASSSADKTARIWDADTGRSLQVLKGHSEKIDKIAFSPDGRSVATAGYDRTIRIWDLRTGKPRKILTGHTDWISGIDFAKSRKVLASSGKDARIILWDPETGLELRRLIGHKLWVNTVKFSPDDRLLASASDDRTVRLWSVGTGQQLLKIRTIREVVAIAFSPDGKLLAVGDAAEVKVYPVDFSALDADPNIQLEQAEAAAGSHLDGFQLSVYKDE